MSLETVKTPHGSDQRETGRHQVFDAIRQAERIARIDIAHQTGFSPATVTAITSELIAAGLIEEIVPDVSPVRTKRGRPRVALKIRGDAHFVIGLKISNRSATAMIVDFEGNAKAQYEAPMPADRLGVDQMVTFIADTIDATCAVAGIDAQDLSGAGLGMAGIIDAQRNFVYWSPSLTERSVELGAMLMKRLPFPVFMDNDANLVAKAEQLFGEGRDFSDFIVITIEHGVGMGIVIDNKIYRGTRGCGAEFGHTKVQLDGALCRCGQRGCLEAYVADYALLREANITSGDAPEDEVASLFARAKAGDKVAQSIFDRAGRMFAMGLANVVNIFDPKLIILSGERMLFDFLYADAVLDAMKASVVQIDGPKPEVRIHKWGDLMWANGAAAYAMEGVAELMLKKMASNAT